MRMIDRITKTFNIGDIISYKSLKSPINGFGSQVSLGRDNRVQDGHLAMIIKTEKEIYEKRYLYFMYSLIEKINFGPLIAEEMEHLNERI